MLRLLVVAVAAVLWAQVGALPSGFSQQYVGSFSYASNVMDMEFLPNGYALLVGRKGLVLIADLYTNNIPQQTYLDLTSVTYSNGMSANWQPRCDWYSKSFR